MKNYQILLCENKNVSQPILLGDFNKNGVIDEADVDKLYSFLERDFYETHFDIDPQKVDFDGNGKLDVSKEIIKPTYPTPESTEEEYASTDLAIFENYLAVKDTIDKLEEVWEDDGKNPTTEERALRYIDFQKDKKISWEDLHIAYATYFELGPEIDPEKDPNATKFTHITYDEVLEMKLKVMDLTAITMCRENNMPIYVFDMDTVGNLEKVMNGEAIGTLVKP